MFNVNDKIKFKINQKQNIKRILITCQQQKQTKQINKQLYFFLQM